MCIGKSIRKLENDFDLKAERFICHHPLLGSLAVFIGMPLLVLICVCAGTVLLAYPIALALGWL